MAIQTENNTISPPSFHGSAPPYYVSASQIAVKSIHERSKDDAVDIKKLTLTTVDITATGLNGALKSGNLAGTIQVSAASVIGTGTTFTTTFQVGDVISCARGNRRITAISNDTNLTCSASFSSNGSGLTYQRGGVAFDTFYYLYAIAQANGANPGLALSQRCDAIGDGLVDLPAGYLYYRQLPFALRTNASSTNGQIMSFRVCGGWPCQPAIFYNTGYTAGLDAPGFLIHSGAAPTTWQYLGSNLYIPSISRMGIFSIYSTDGTATNTTSYQIRDPGVTPLTNAQIGACGAYSISLQTRCTLNASGLSSHKINTAKTVDVFAVGYIITGVS
ncbi:MAG: hypothetical protein K0S07_1353 [Chlamydiales bacterium]|jgi:hypothetical protein|nr:hypothetical protein [Chlamydiales bacterium]